MKYKVLRNIRVGTKSGLKVFKAGEVVSGDEFIADPLSFVRSKYLEEVAEKKVAKKEAVGVAEVEVSEKKVSKKKAKKKSKKKSKKKVSL